jgi:hypothetical protein
MFINFLSALQFDVVYHDFVVSATRRRLVSPGGAGVGWICKTFIYRGRNLSQPQSFVLLSSQVKDSVKRNHRSRTFFSWLFILAVLFGSVGIISKPTMASTDTEIVVDDGDAGFTATAGWTVVTSNWSRNCGGYGGDARWTMSRRVGYTNDSDSVTWKPNLPQDGDYEVWVYFPGINNGANDTTQAKYVVQSRWNTTPVVVSQRNNWCGWINLGTYYFVSGNSGYVYLGDYTGDNPQNAITADAVKFVYKPASPPPPPPATEVVIDDGDTGFTSSGGWTTVTSNWSRSCIGNNGDARWTLSRRVGFTDNVDYAKWQPNLTQAGDYEVWVYFPGINNGSNDTAQAKYVVQSAWNTTAVPVSQRNNWCGWIKLGTFYFNTGTGGYVYLGDYTSDNPQNAITADAVKFVLTSNAPPPAPSPTPAPPPVATYGNPITVDDGDAQFQMRDPSSWNVVTSNWSQCQGINGDARWTTSRRTGTDDIDFVRWNFDGPTGMYEVFAYFGRFNNGLSDTASAQYKINHANGLALQTLSQTGNWCDWRSLGRYKFNGGDPSNNYVYLGDFTNTGENAPNQRSVIADAIKFVPVNSPPNKPGLVSPAADAKLNSASVILSISDGGDPDNLPNNFRNYCFRIERADGSWAQDNCWSMQTSWTVSLPSPGTYRWRAQAGDGLIGSDVTDWRLFSYAAAGDTTPPTGSVTAPANNATVGPSTVDFRADASDNAGGSGVDHVDFYLKFNGNWVLACTDYASPYTCGWTTPEGLRTQQVIFTIHVVDKAGNRTIDPGGYRYVQFNAPVVVPPPVVPDLPPAKAGFPIPYLSQQDKHWVDERLASSINSKCTTTIGAGGCYMTSLAMVLNYYGFKVTPIDVRNANPAQYDCNLAPSIVASKLSGGKVRVERWEGTYANLDKALNKDNKVVIVQLHKTRCKENGVVVTCDRYHYMPVLSGSGDKPANYIVHESGTLGGQNRSLNLRVKDGYLLDKLIVFSGPNPNNAFAMYTLSYGIEPLADGLLPLPSNTPQTLSTAGLQGIVQTYRADDLSMVISVQSTGSTTPTEMRLWSDTSPDNLWIPFGPLVRMPIDDVVYAQFRDANGQVSEVFSTTLYPITGDIDLGVNEPELPLTPEPTTPPTQPTPQPPAQPTPQPPAQPTPPSLSPRVYVPLLQRGR